MGFRWQLPKKVNCRTACTSRLQLRLADGKSPLGVNSARSVSYVLKPDADCRRGRLVPRFRLTSRSAASGVNLRRHPASSAPRPSSADYRGLQITPELNLAVGGEILVSGMYPEIAPTRPSKADFAIHRAHKSGPEGRHVRARVLEYPGCQLLGHFLRAHVLCDLVHPDLQSSLITYLVTAHCKSRRNATSGHRSRMRTAGEGGLSPVSASRAAVPHPAGTPCDCNCASQAGKVCSASTQSAR